VAGHGGNHPKKIAGAQGIAPFLGNYFHFLGNPHFSFADDKKTVGVLLPFHYTVGTFGETNKCKLELTRHSFSRCFLNPVIVD
jgi:hypothetical protein